MLFPQSRFLLLITLCAQFLSPNAQAAPDGNMAAQATNALGIDLHRHLATANPAANLCLSPYSIQTALAMTWAGASGETQAEMARILHYPSDEPALHRAFGALQRDLTPAGKGPRAMELRVANRLFGQEGYAFRPPFLTAVEQNYAAPMQAMDFIHNHESATRQINAWVAKMTEDRIRDLIPSGALTEETRLVLTNALYFKAVWHEAFEKNSTQNLPFYGVDGKKVNVPTMQRTGRIGYMERDGYTAVSLNYAGGDLHLLVLLPKERDGLAALEKRLTPEMLEGCKNLPKREVTLAMPKFRIEPPTVPLADVLQAMGMKRAFDKPQGSADFDRMAPRKPDDYLYISEVFHKTFLVVDEAGTEAAAATAVVMMRAMAMVEQEPTVAVTVDHPFLFALQHGASGACLFLGRVAKLPAAK